MILDKSAVLEIINTHFLKNVELEAARSIMELESYELEEDFENTVDYADLDEVNEVEVEEVKVDQTAGIYNISGLLRLWVTITGFVYWDGDYEEIGTSGKEMEFAFYFEIEDGSYTNFEVEGLL